MTTTTATRILLADGWHDVAVLTWPPFRGGPGFAALVSSGRRWIVGPVTALLAVDSDNEVLDAVLTRLDSLGLVDQDELATILARVVEDVVSQRARDDADVVTLDEDD